MKSSRIAATGLAAALVVSGSVAFSGGLARGAQQKEIAFDSAGDFLTMPADIHLGEVAGVATTSTGNLWVYNQGGGLNLTVGAARLHPAGGARLFEFDKSGKFVRELGSTNEERPYGFRWAQGVRVDPQSNVWTVDRGSRTIIKFAPDGRILMILGRTPEAIGEVGSSAGAGPVAVVAAAAAKVAVPAVPVRRRGGAPAAAPPAPPGPRRQRLAQRPVAVAAVVAVAAAERPAPVRPATVSTSRPMSPGTLRATSSSPTGTPTRASPSSTEPGGSRSPGAGRVPDLASSIFRARIAVDAKGMVYVADMGNKRIQVFDNDGNFKTEFKNVGAPRAICISPGAQQFLYASNSNPTEDPFLDGEIYKMQLDGTIVGRIGRAGKQFKEFGMVNGIDCREPNTLYVAELMNWRVQKLTLK